METSQARTTGPGLLRMGRFEFTTEPGVCDTHGPFQNMKTPVGFAGCPTCNSERIAREDAKRAAQAEQEFLQRRADNLLRKAAIPPRFADRRLENFVPHSDGPRKALAVATEYADGFEHALETGQSLIFCGGVGAGKTHLAVGIAHRVMGMGRMAVFTSVIGAIRTVKETYSRDSEKTEAEALENLTKPDLLILDEVGVQFGSETEKMILFEIINGRYEKLRPTIVISNLAKEPLTEYLGERVVDRLREGGGRMVIFDWPSYRRIAS